MNEKLEQAFRVSVHSIDRRPIAEWARDNVTLPPTLTKGRFDTSESLHFNDPLVSIGADTVREVNIMAPPRSAKTLIADVSAPWAVANDNASVLWVFQDEANAKLHAELRAKPIFQSVPQLAAIWPDDRHQDRTKEIIFSNGLPFVITGPAIGKLQSRGYKWVICDEPWQYDAGILAEAKARLGDFEKTAASKLICISQGGKSGDDWTSQFETGELHEWQVSCMACGHYMTPRWSAFRPDETRWGIVYESVKDEKRRHNKARAIETMRFECEKCGFGHRFSPRTLAHWNKTGRYASCSQPNARKKSYHWNDLITGAPWETMLEEWLEAEDAFNTQRNAVPREKFIQKRLAESLSDSSIYGERLFGRASMEVASDWPEEVERFATFDRQHEGVYYGTVRAWAKTGESRRLFRGLLYGIGEVQNVIEQYKVPTFITTQGRQSSAFMDSGDAAKGADGVYAQCIRLGMIALKGDGQREGFVHQLAKGKVTQRIYAPVTHGDPFDGQSHRPVIEQKYQIRGIPAGLSVLFSFATNPCKTRLQGLIDSGLWKEPPRDDSEEEQDYRKQMSSEVRDPKTGKWGERNRKNHYWDCASMQCAAASMVGII